MNDIKYLKISDLNNYIKLMFDENPYLKKVYLRGEISNFKNHSRGHLYFTLKDETSRINAVMFYSQAMNINFVPEDGINVLVEGRISSYPAQGSYQIYVDKMEVDGIGELYIEFEKLKKKLAQEGLFADDHKKPIPKIPQRIGIVTAPTGAAIKDIISTIKRRFPLCETILFPSLVQGASAAQDIVKNIQEADSGKYDLDCLIVGRGGGSIEDLWAFNEEIVARAIYEARVPIISAVGHEIDFTIADFVADMRAPTPTGAAEMAVPTTIEIKNVLHSFQIRLNENIHNKLHNNTLKLQALKNTYVLKNPLTLYELKEQKLDTLIDSLNNYIHKSLDNYQLILTNLKNSYILNNPFNLIKQPQEKLEFLSKSLYNNITNILEKKTYLKDLLINTLKLVNPLGILDKGYSLVKKDNKLIKDSQDLKVNDSLNIQFLKGQVIAEVKEVNHG